eukprot:jgi/Bigna1/76127/fgenesh1_pg.39_\
MNNDSKPVKSWPAGEAKVCGASKSCPANVFMPGKSTLPAGRNGETKQRRRKRKRGGKKVRKFKVKQSSKRHVDIGPRGRSPVVASPSIASSSPSTGQDSKAIADPDLEYPLVSLRSLEPASSLPTTPTRCVSNTSPHCHGGSEAPQTAVVRSENTRKKTKERMKKKMKKKKKEKKKKQDKLTGQKKKGKRRKQKGLIKKMRPLEVVDSSMTSSSSSIKADAGSPAPLSGGSLLLNSSENLALLVLDDDTTPSRTTTPTATATSSSSPSSSRASQYLDRKEDIRTMIESDDSAIEYECRSVESYLPDPPDGMVLCRVCAIPSKINDWCCTMCGSLLRIDQM